jgi:branched-chain amino acid transport system permease protein
MAAAKSKQKTARPLWLLDVALLATAIGLGAWMPEYLAFATRVVVMILFVLSLDLVLGYAGIPTLGHAAIYGVGAYAAGIFAIHVSADPLTGLVVAAVAGGATAFISGLLLLRTNRLTLVMLSIAVVQIAYEIANKAGKLTGGADGLDGIIMAPVVGRFEFDFAGYTAFYYSLAILAILFLVLKRIVRSPFGLSCQGIREQKARMEALGVPVYGRLLVMYTLAGAIAGTAGGLMAQTTQFVSLEALGFGLSAEAVIMLILGGAGRLYGAIIGTTVYMLVHHVASGIAPTNWLFVIGGLIIVTVFFAPKGLLSLLPRHLTRGGP